MSNTANHHPDEDGPGATAEASGLLDGAEHVEAVTLHVGEDPGWGVPTGAFTKLGSGLAVVVGMLALSYAVPGLEFAQPWRADEQYVPFWNVVGREFMGQEVADADELERLNALAREEPVDTEPVEDRVVAPPPLEVDRWPQYPGHEDDKVSVERAIENPAALEPFFARLTRTDLGYPEAITRVAHWGDSVLGNDGITSEIRRRMQRRFGDSGHGFHSLTQYDPSYRHQGIWFMEKTPWTKCFIIKKCKNDGRYGYGGITAFSAGGGESRFETVDDGPVGRKWSAIELWYLAQPRGGRVTVTIDDRDAVVLDTDAEQAEDRWERFTLEDGKHKVRIRASGGGQARAYGVVFERDRPGVVWDGMALIGGFTSRLAEHDPEHLAAQLGRRDPALLVLTFGGNDMIRKKLASDMTPYEEDYGLVLDRLRKAAPNAACMVMSPIDHGERSGGKVVSRAIVGPMVEAQRKVALAHGCAFFDTYSAMGGDGSMGRWYGMKPKLASGDLAHPTRAGHRVLGGMVYRALMRDYANYRQSIAGTPMPGRAAAGEAADNAEAADTAEAVDAADAETDALNTAKAAPQ